MCPFISFIAPRFVSLGMEQVFWFSDDDLQEEIFDRANELAREHKLI